MNTAQFTITFLFLLCSSLSYSNDIDNNWEEKVRTQLNAVLGNSFNIDSWKVQTSEKKVTGIGTFFKQSGVGFEIHYNGAEEIGFFEATMPAKAKVAVSQGEISNLAGEKLSAFVPKALNKALNLERFSFTISKETKKPELFTFHFNALKNWEIFKSSHFALEQIHCVFNIHQPTEKEKRSLQGILTGMTKIGSVSVDMSADLKRNEEDLEISGIPRGLELKSSLQNIAGRSAIKGFSILDKVLRLNLEQSKITIAPYRDWLRLESTSNLGAVDGFFQKNKTKGKKSKTSYLVTISPPTNFKLSQLNSKLSALDFVNLSNQKIVLSSEKKSKKETSKIPSMAQVATGIQKGCTMVAKLDLTKLKIDHLIGMKELIVNSPLSDQIGDFAFQGEIGKDVAIGSTAKLKGVTFRLQPNPKDFSVSLLGTMDTKIEDDLLAFTGGMEIEVNNQKLNFVALMDGKWNEPLGAKGLAVRDLGIQMGASFTTAPTILPNIALGGTLNLGSFKGDATVAFDSRNPTKSMMSGHFNKIKLWDIIKATSTKKVQKNIPNEMQKTLKGFSLSDVGVEFVPVPVTVLEKKFDAGFRMAGAMEAVGIKGNVGFDIDYKNGISANGSVDPIDLKIFKLTGANGKKRPAFIMDLRKGNKAKLGLNGMVNLMGLEAETDVEILPDGFKFAIGGKIFHLFKADIKASGKDLEKAGDMQLQVKMKNDLLGFIEKEATKFIKNSTAGSIEGLTKAQATLTQAQKKIKEIDKAKKAMRKIVIKDQAEDVKKLNTAIANVNKAQAVVDKLNSEISKLQKQSRKLTKLTQKPEKLYIEGKIKGLQGTKGTATFTLNRAKDVMNLMKKANTNPDLDSRMIALEATKKSALKTLDIAKGGMELAKKGLGFSADAGTFIVKHGTNGIVNVRKADFKGKLGSMSGGAVKLNLDLEWMGKSKKIKFDFDFNDAAKSVANLAKELMKTK